MTELPDLGLALAGFMLAVMVSVLLGSESTRAARDAASGVGALVKVEENRP